jgi:hypothetical protein
MNDKNKTVSFQQLCCSLEFEKMLLESWIKDLDAYPEQEQKRPSQ